MGLGVVVRNSDGLVMVSLAQKIRLPSSVIEVEVVAVRKELKLDIELGIYRIILEGDSETLYMALKIEGSNLAPYGHLWPVWMLKNRGGVE